MGAEWTEALPWLTGGLMICAGLAVLRRPFETLCRLLLRTGAGLAVLWILAECGFSGLTLGVNLINALILGLFGVPGFGLLLLLKWVLALP